MLIRLFRYLDKVMAAVLTALLWYLQEFEGDKNFSCPDYLAKYKFEIAYFGLLVTLLTALITSLYEELTKRRAIDSWAKNFMSHIIEQHLCGGDSKTRITIFKPQKGYKLILPYIFCYPIKAFFMTDYKINGQAFWSNIPYKLFSDYLAVYSRYCYSSNKKSYTHFMVSSRTDRAYNGIADKCYREQVESSAYTPLINHEDLAKSYEKANSRVKKYMADSYIDSKYYDALRSMNTISNNLYAVPIFYSNQKIWGVMIIDSVSKKEIDFQEFLEDYIAQYQNIFSFTIQILN